MNDLTWNKGLRVAFNSVAIMVFLGLLWGEMDAVRALEIIIPAVVLYVGLVGPD